ncbi:MAG: hypothetical protein FIA94_13890 [Nitrospirae bacterium]|nr:hypothetical protein [Nitrospirota bacterium]
MKRFLTGTLFFFLISFCAYTERSFASTEEWTTIGNGVYINEETLTHITGSIHSLWIKIVPDKDSALYARSRKLLRELGKEHASLEYMGYLTEVDCMNGRFRELTAMFYRKDKNILGSLQKESPAWQEIKNGNMMTGVYRTVCEDFLTTEPYEGTC